MRNYCYPLLSHSFECGTWWQVRYTNPKVPASAARTDASFGQDVCTRLCAVICQGPLGIKGTLFSDVLYVKVHVKDHPSFSPFSSRIFLICACLTLALHRSKVVFPARHAAFFFNGGVSDVIVPWPSLRSETVDQGQKIVIDIDKLPL